MRANSQRTLALVGDFSDHYVKTGIHIFPVDVTHFPAVTCQYVNPRHSLYKGEDLPSLPRSSSPQLVVEIN